ncbi:hypothetical protein [Mycolicibacterium neoaurum]|uniref:hypothetical protein n=1 Tax=Mycolicibacterium neoaurum TaxID=1795 RepID=UPI001F4D1C98|nr:hypothetical protein [Mycolicibacterium neoaurum]
MTEVPALTPPGSAARWVAPAAAIAVGLAAASVACAVLARALSNPVLPLSTDRPAVGAILGRSAVVTVLMVVLFAIFALMTLRRGSGDAGQRRAALLRHLAPMMFAVGACGVWWRMQDSTTDLLDDARAQQASLDGVDVVGLASIGWICACLAVLVLAVATGVGGPRLDHHGRGRSHLIASAIAVLTAVAVGGAVVLVVTNPTVHHAATSTAPATPGAVNIDGPVAYTIPVDDTPDYFLAAGGPGLLHSNSDSDGLQALSGATGEQMWAFSYPDLWVFRAAGGPKTAGVTVLEARYLSESVMIGLDAATGAPLWTRPGAGSLVARRAGTPQLSSQHLLTVRSVMASPTSSRQLLQWTVREVRTGNPLWSFTTGPECAYSPTLTETAVLTARCTDTQMIDVLDAQTGARRASLSAADLGGGMTANDPIRAMSLPGTDRAVLSSPNYPFKDLRPAAVVDTVTGEITQQLPANTAVTVLDSRTLILADAQQRDLVFDLDTNTTIETGLSSAYSHYNNTPLGSVWARVADQFVTLTPAPGQGPALSVFSHEEPMKTYPAPCTSQKVPTVLSIPTALLVNCADQIVAMH